MSGSDILLVVISGLGVIHGLFLAVFLIIYKEGNPIANKILSFLLLILSFRVGKSVFLEFTENLDVKFIFTGLATLMAVGPLFLFYVKSIVDPSFRVKQRQLLHFIPSLVGVIFGLWLEPEHLNTLPKALFLFVFLGYYLHYLTYLTIATKTIYKSRNRGINESSFSLLRILALGLGLLWLVYVLNLFDEVVPYIIGPIMYSVVAYVISFIIIHKGYIKSVEYTKYKTTPIASDQIEDIFKKVSNLLAEEKLYKESNLTLKMLSEKLHVSTQIISLVINKKSESNFNNFVNQYRIEEAQNLIADKNNDHLTIAAIAFEVGFNSISSFNTAFKKSTGFTPSSYKKSLTE